MTSENDQKTISDFAAGKESSTLRVLILKLNAYSYEIIKAEASAMGDDTEAKMLYGFTHSSEEHDVVLNNDRPLDEQVVTLIHEVLHLMYKYAPEEEVESAGQRLFLHLTEQQLLFLKTYISFLPVWKSKGKHRKLRKV